MHLAMVQEITKKVRMGEEKEVKIKWVNIAKSLGRCGECVEENTKSV